MPFFSPLSLNKKKILLYFPLSLISSNDIQLKMFVFVVVNMFFIIIMNMQVERAESVVSA